MRESYLGQTVVFRLSAHETTSKLANMMYYSVCDSLYLDHRCKMKNERVIKYVAPFTSAFLRAVFCTDVAVYCNAALSEGIHALGFERDWGRSAFQLSKRQESRQLRG